MSHTSFVTSGDQQIAVHEHGSRDRPTVVLVHGYPDSSSVWNRTAELLAKDFHVVTYDVRGSGESSIPTRVQDYALDLLVDDAAAVIDAVSPDQPVHLVGHDWGSIQSWETVTTERLRGRIASYTTMSGPSLDHVGHWLQSRLRSGAPAELSRVAAQALHSWYIGMFQMPVLPPLIWKVGLDKLWPHLLTRLEGTPIEGTRTQRKDGQHGINLYRANVRQRLTSPNQRRTDIPVQMIVALRDPFVGLQILDDVQQWAPNLWRSHVDAGHWLPITQPELIADKVKNFVHFVETGDEPPALQRARVRGPTIRKHSGKLVVVTGAGSGIGRETVLAFAEAGAATIAVDINRSAAERSAQLAGLFDSYSVAYALDVGDANAMAQFAEDIAQTHGTPDIVVNNAGIGMSGPVLDTSTADWQRILNVNLWGVIHGSRLFAQQMISAGKRGHIVNVSSGLAFFPTRITPAYNTTKAAVQMLTECLRAELAHQRIGVTAVYPGVVNTNIVSTATMVGESLSGAQRKRARANRLYELRNLKPEAVARAIVNGVEKNLPEVRVGAEVHAIRWLSRLAPGVARRLARMDA